MNNQPLLSVIIPVYKVEKYLRRCLDSIVNQTYKNLEIILVDDGSPDNSGKICDEYAQKDKRIKVIHQKNKGLSGARNTGTEIARGEYVAYVDSDDWLDINMYEELILKLQQYQLDMVRCAAYASDGDVNELIAPKKCYKNKIFCDNEIMNRYFDEFLCKIVWNAVYKKDIVKGIVSPERCHSQDNYVSGMYLFRSKRMMIIDKPLYYYRKNPESITNSGNRRAIDICICTNQLIHDLKKAGLADVKILKLLNKKLARELFHFIRGGITTYKLTNIQKDMFNYIYYNLDLRRKVELKYLLVTRHIEIID